MDTHRTLSSTSPTTPAPRGRRPLEVAAAAITAGALLTGSVQLGTATAAATPAHRVEDGTVQLQLPAGQFLPGIDIPALVEATQRWTPPSAAHWKPAPMLTAPAPAPEPQGSPMPEPAPAPVPAPVPAPEAAPAPAPAPEAVPAPEALPAPAPEAPPAPAPAPMPVPVLPPPPPPAVQPVAGFLTSSYGPRWGTHHNGIDIGADTGTPIHSAASGVVINAGPASGFGLWVRVRHDDGTIAVYGHVDTYLVWVGQRVDVGQLIATVGSRGQSTGPHLHFEIWRGNGHQMDPMIWLREKGVEPNW